MSLKRWRHVNLSQAAALIYLRHSKRDSTNSMLLVKQHFYLNEDYASGEVFFEKIQEGFWLVAMEIKAKENTYYLFAPKPKTDFHSINFFSGTQKIGYQEGNDIYWADNHALYFNAKSSNGIYLKENTILKYNRLIFTDAFLRSLTGKDRQFASATVESCRIIRNRETVKGELFLQSRLFDILRYEREKNHFHSSLFSTVYGLTASFIKLSSRVKTEVNGASEKRNSHIMLKAAMILEANIFDGFPGISELASNCNISLSKLKRDFKEHFGTTPLNYYRNLQISYIMPSLHGHEKTIKQIAAELGFKKSNTFSSWYKKINE